MKLQEFLTRIKDNLLHISTLNFCFYAFIFLLAILPAILQFLFIRHFGVNVVFIDEWKCFQPVLKQYYSGHLNFWDLFLQHGEHRIFFPKIIFLIMAPLTHWNSLYQMYLSWSLLIITSIILFYLYQKHFGISKGSLILFLPVPWLLFTLRSWEKILQAVSFGGSLTLCCLVLSFALIESSKKIDCKFFLAIITGIIASFSMIYGLLVWPIGFLLILLTKEAKKTYSVLWGLAGCLTYATFFIFIPWYPQSSHPPTISYIIEHPLLGIQYFISNIGSPFASTYPEAFYFGIILILGLICISIILIKYQHLQENGIWIAIILYSFGFSLMATIGRAGFGDIEYLLTSRYVGTTVIGVIGLYLLTLSVQRTFLAKKIIHSIVFLALVIGIIVFGVYAGYGNGLKYGAIWSANQQDGANALLYYKVATDEELRLITPAPDDVREKAKFLEANNLSVFHPDAKKAPYLNTHKKMLANPIYVNTYPGQPISSIYGIIDFKSKKVLLQQPFQMDQNPAIIQFNNVSVSNNSSLSFSIAMSPEVWSPEQGDGATFNVYVNVVNPENLIFSHYIDPKNNPADRRWNNYNVSLSKYAGQNISLVFSTLPGPNNNPAWDSAWWGEPSVVESKI